VTPRRSLTKSTNPPEASAPKLLFPFLDLKAEYATAAIAQVMESQQFIMGPQVRELEAEVASLIGCDFAMLSPSARATTTSSWATSEHSAVSVSSPPRIWEGPAAA